MSAFKREAFNTASAVKTKREVGYPLSFRVTPSEKRLITERANGRPISTYLRHVALSGDALPRRKAHAPDVNDAKVAQILAALGTSRLASNLNQLAKSANIGTLPVTDELCDDLHAACAAVQSMRHDLIIALGIKAEG